MRITNIGRRIGAGLAGLAVAGATALVVTTSPAANAAVDNITVSSAEVKVGETYTLHATLSGPSIGLLVYWNDNGTSLTGNIGKVPIPVGNSVLEWTPTTAGQHIITASQGSSTSHLIINVSDGSGTTTPPANTVPPTTPPATTEPTTPPTTTKPSSGSGGSSSGSGGSGSAGKLLGGLLGSS